MIHDFPSIYRFYRDFPLPRLLKAKIVILTHRCYPKSPGSRAPPRSEADPTPTPEPPLTRPAQRMGSIQLEGLYKVGDD